MCTSYCASMGVKSLINQVRLTGHNLHSLLVYADLDLALGRYERAVETYALLEKHFTTLHHPARQIIADKLNVLHSTLSPDQFTRARVQGYTLELDAAISAAIRDLSEASPIEL